MKIDHLIAQLSFDRKPVKPIESFFQRFIKWFLVAIFCVTSSKAFLGLRADWTIVFKNPILLIQNVLILINIITSSTAAICLSVPGSERKSFTRFAVAVPVILWLVLLLVAGINVNFNPGLGFSCIKDICIIGIIPGIILFYIIKRGATLLRGYVGILVLLSSGGLGVWALQFTCRNDEVSHILVWHFLPFILLGLMGWVIGTIVIKKI